MAPNPSFKIFGAMKVTEFMRCAKQNCCMHNAYNIHIYFVAILYY
jgi:hypothetical protein